MVLGAESPAQVVGGVDPAREDGIDAGYPSQGGSLGVGQAEEASLGRGVRLGVHMMDGWMDNMGIVKETRGVRTSQLGALCSARVEEMWMIEESPATSMPGSASLMA